MIIHKGWDINEHETGRFKWDEVNKINRPIKGATFQNGLNDKNPNGSFSPCDMGITEESDGVTYLRAKRGRWGQMRFGDSSHPNSFLVKIKDKGLKGLSFKYTGGNGASMTANNGKPLCSFDNGISIESAPKYNGVKIDIIVDDPANAPTTYPFSVKTYGQNYTFTNYPDGRILAMGDDDKAIHFQPPYAIDANGDIGAVHYNIIGTYGGYWLFEKVVDEAWLRQAAAPVRIDPDITIEDGVDGGVIEDANLLSSTPDNNWGGSTKGRVSSGTQTELLKVDLTSLAGVTPVSSHFGLDVYFTTVGKRLRWFEVLIAYVNGTGVNTPASGDCSWNDAIQGTSSWTTSGCRGAGSDRNAVHDGEAFPNVSSDFHFDITNPLAQRGIDAGLLAITTDDPGSTTGRTDWRATEATIGNKPYFYMEYIEAVGGRLRAIGRGINRGIGRGL